MYAKEPDVFGGTKLGRVLLRRFKRAGIAPGEGGTPSLAALLDQFTPPIGTIFYHSDNLTDVFEIRENTKPIKSVVHILAKKAT